VLDVGCGTGTLITALARDRVGIDNSPSMIRKGAEKKDGCTLMVSDICSLPFRDGSFSLTYRTVVHYYLSSYSKIRASVNEMLRVTGPGGYIVVWELNSGNPLVRRLTRKIPWNRNIRFVSDEEIRKIAGKRKVEILKKSFVPNFAPKLLIRPLAAAEKAMEFVRIFGFIFGHRIYVIRK
jgi:ubiquinone/menaquinone biosynthesis C-methylase UbiE